MQMKIFVSVFTKSDAMPRGPTFTNPATERKIVMQQ